MTHTSRKSPPKVIRIPRRTYTCRRCLSSNRIEDDRCTQCGESRPTESPQCSSDGTTETNTSRSVKR